MNDLAQQAHTLQELWQQRNTVDNSWLRQRQKEALGTFSKQGFPDKRLENWRYTDLRELARRYPDWLAKTGPAAAFSQAAALQLESPIRITFVDGIFREDLSDELPDGVFAGSAGELANQHSELVTERWGALAKDHDSGLISLNSAFGDSAVAIVVAEGVRLAEPVYINFTGATSQSVTLPRVLISLAADSRATVIEHYSSTATRIVNAVTEIDCGPRSQLNYYKLQEDAGTSWHTAVQSAALAAEASIATAHIDLGAELSRNELNIYLRGEHAKAECNGVFVADKKGYVETRINVEHAAPHTLSKERFRGILSDNAKGVFNGRILVEQIAQKTSAELSNRNLLLSKGAEINTKPELEIYADDVKCAHGSTTGQLDEQALFYLLSRGIAREEARNLLILAFASELVSSLGIASLGEKVRHRLAQLGGTDE